MKIFTKLVLFKGFMALCVAAGAFSFFSRGLIAMDPQSSELSLLVPHRRMPSIEQILEDIKENPLIAPVDQPNVPVAGDALKYVPREEENFILRMAFLKVPKEYHRAIEEIEASDPIKRLEAFAGTLQKKAREKVLDYVKVRKVVKDAKMGSGLLPGQKVSKEIPE